MSLSASQTTSNLSPEPEAAGPNTFYTSPSHGAGLRGIELDRCYVGDYVAGRRHGFGTYTYPNSFFQYEGQWVNGKKHGLGKLSMRDSSYYEGEFVEGEIMGQGTRRFANGNVYIGTFHMGEMHGFGVMKLANGDTYQGPFVHNTFEGVGVYTHASGDVFQGDYKGHKRCGQGVLTRADGSRYEGGWVDNQQCGQGEATYPDGSWYKGAWELSRYHGQGEWFQARAGLTYRGLFIEGRPALVPQQLTLTWEVEEDPKAPKPRKPGPPPPGAAGGAAGLGAGRSGTGEPEPVQPLPVVLGEPLPMPLAVAAQLLQPKPPRSSPSPPPDPGRPKGSRHATPQLPPAPARVPVVNQPPTPGHVWRTAEMEWGRQVNLTLHLEPPSPLPPDRLLRALVVNTLMPDGSTRVRVLISTSVHLPPALPFCRVPPPGAAADAAAGGGEAADGGTAAVAAAGGGSGSGGGILVSSVQVELEAGQRVIEGLVIGSAEDAERLTSATAVGYLVASSAGAGVAPGVCRVMLPEPKVKKPGTK